MLAGGEKTEGRGDRGRERGEDRGKRGTVLVAKLVKPASVWGL